MAPCAYGTAPFVNAGLSIETFRQAALTSGLNEGTNYEFKVHTFIITGPGGSLKALKGPFRCHSDILSQVCLVPLIAGFSECSA